MQSAVIAKDALIAIGAQNIKIVSNIMEAKSILLNENILFIILELKVAGEPSLEFVQWLRKDSKNKNRMIPVIALTGLVSKETVADARDAGVTEFVAKPFKIETLRNALMLSLKNPRNFIISRNFTGPDRRRRNEAPPHGKERRNQNSQNDDNA